MRKTLNEPIDVLASFSDSFVKPLHMRWNQKNYTIKNINLINTAHDGQKKIFYFSVSDVANFFKLKLDTDTLKWHLVEVCSS